MECTGCGRRDFETVGPDDVQEPVIQCRVCHRIFSLRYAWVEVAAEDRGKVVPMRRR